MIQVYELSEIECPEVYLEQVREWSNLWYEDLEEAGVDRVYLAFEDDGDEVLGFQSVSRDGLCVAIEVDSVFQGKGVASALVEESNVWRPESNENPGFWAAIAEKFEES